MKYRRKLSYLLTFPRHASRAAYYSKGLMREFSPYTHCMRQTERLLSALRSCPDYAEIERRALYYNKLDEAFDASIAPKIDTIDNKRSRYYFDLIEHAKGFGPERRLNYLFGDITRVPEQPTVVKSRPIHGDNRNSIILNLNKFRHFSWSADATPFREKRIQPCGGEHLVHQPATYWLRNSMIIRCSILDMSIATSAIFQQKVR